MINLVLSSVTPAGTNSVTSSRLINTSFALVAATVVSNVVDQNSYIELYHSFDTNVSQVPSISGDRILPAVSSIGKLYPVTFPMRLQILFIVREKPTSFKLFHNNGSASDVIAQVILEVVELSDRDVMNIL